ncbi:hypothetical protein C8J57DRAFT_1496287 [Mycena rebaudengoi]|nr:hypothetical protein C8J57DRAFT_1496287 [Mycena rebaudengoi]
MPKAAKPEVLRRSGSFWADQQKLRAQNTAMHACNNSAYAAYEPPPSGKTISGPDFSKAPSEPSRRWAPAPKPRPGPSAADLKLVQDDAEPLAKLTRPKKGEKSYIPAAETSSASASKKASRREAGGLEWQPFILGNSVAVSPHAAPEDVAHALPGVTIPQPVLPQREESSRLGSLQLAVASKRHGGRGEEMPSGLPPSLGIPLSGGVDAQLQRMLVPAQIVMSSPHGGGHEAQLEDLHMKLGQDVRNML